MSKQNEMRKSKARKYQKVKAITVCLRPDVIYRFSTNEKKI